MDLKKMLSRTWLMFCLLFTASAATSPAATDQGSIDTARLHAMIVDNAYRLEGGRAMPFIVFDARPRRDYDAAHIFSAVSSPADDFERNAALLPRDTGTQLVVYDNDGNDEASLAWARKAAARGYRNVIIYADGFPAWQAQGMPVAPLSTGPQTKTN